MPYRIEAVRDRRAMDDFLGLPFALYRDAPNWVPPLVSDVRRTLDRDRNPYFAQAVLELFVGYRDDTPVARTCVVINPAHWAKFGQKAAFFGFFESRDDEAAAGRLFEAARGFCRAQGAELLEGPFNPNHYSELGLQTSEFGTRPHFFETDNPAYYLRLVAAAGFRVSRRVHTCIRRNVGEYVRNRYGEAKTARARDGFRIRPVRLPDLKAELERIREVNNDAFADNWHFLPLSREEYTFAANYLFFVTYPRLVAIVEHEGSPVGVLQFVLDINPLLQRMRGRAGLLNYAKFLAARGRIRDIVLYTVGVKKAYQDTPAYRLMLDYACAVARHYRNMVTTWTSDDNRPAALAARRMGLEPGRQFAIYEQAI